MQPQDAVSGVVTPLKVIRLNERLAAAHAARHPDDQGRIRSFDRDQEIFVKGDPAVGFYEVLSGAVRSFTMLSDGRRHIDAFHLPGDLFGLGIGTYHRFSAEAVGNAILSFRRRSRGYSLTAGHSPHDGRLLKAMAHALDRAQDHMLLLGRKSVPERIASFLVGMAQRSGRGGIIDLPMSRTDIADHLGLTTETVSRTLTHFVKAGVIEFVPSRRVVVVRDAAALARLHAGEPKAASRRVAPSDSAVVPIRSH